MQHCVPSSCVPQPVVRPRNQPSFRSPCRPNRGSLGRGRELETPHSDLSANRARFGSTGPHEIRILAPDLFNSRFEAASAAGPSKSLPNIAAPALAARNLETIRVCTNFSWSRMASNGRSPLLKRLRPSVNRIGDASGDLRVLRGSSCSSRSSWIFVLFVFFVDLRVTSRRSSVLPPQP